MPLPQFEVFQLQPPHPRAGLWTFTVDGKESLYYCPHEEAARRVVRRLSDPYALRSRESNGYAAPGGRATRQPRVQIHDLEDGRCAYRLDGGEPVECDSKEEAHAHADAAAFMTRGKLGRLAEAKEVAERELGCRCEIEVRGGKIVAVTKDGACPVSVPADGGPIALKPPGE